MKNWVLILMLIAINIFDCSNKELEKHTTINFPYHLVDSSNSDFQNCLSETNTSVCSRVSWEMSFIGDYYKTLELWNVDNRTVYTTKKDSSINLSDFEIKPAKDILLKLIKNEKVVMFNEAHHLPHHRITTMDYLEDMYVLGFRYLGLEGLKEEGDTLMKRKSPTINSGYYLKEPQYSNLIKKAIRLGYQVFDYDKGGSGKERELNQANEIAEVLKKDKEAKILIHAGWGHIREDTLILGGLMAKEFEKKTGVNPFTINQTRFNEQSKKEYEHFIYRKLKHENLSEPSLLVNKKDGRIYTDSITDIILFHPRTKKINNRPSYLGNSNQFSSKSINFKKNKNQRLLIIVYEDNSDLSVEDKIAVDVTIKEVGISKVDLYIPFKGNYMVYAINSLDEKKEIKRIKL